jgi:predicted deacylase
MPEYIVLGGQKVGLGENKIINYDIARLPSGMMINMPVFIYRSKTDGPVLLLSGGLHGDEVNGIEIIRRMIAEQTFSNLFAGTVIAIPVLNVFGFLNYSREVPDGKDVNRSFPGDANGSLASRVAYHLTKNIIPLIDYGVDFHTGGAQRTNYPQMRYSVIDKNSELIAKAFAAPFTLNSGLIPKSIRHQGSKMGKPIIVFEGGESMRFDELSISEAIDGTKRLLCYLGMMNEKYQERKGVLLMDSSWVRASRAGMFKPFIDCGEPVVKNQPIGVINDPFGMYEIKVISKYDGFIIGMNNNPVVHQGDALFHIGLEKEKKSKSSAGEE